MHTELVTQPAIEPVTLDQAKNLLKISFDDDDDLITSMLIQAREMCEVYTNRAFITQTWTTYADSWEEISTYGGTTNSTLAFRSAYPKMVLSKPPLQSISQVLYYDSQNNPIVWDSSDYRVSPGNPGRLAPINIYTFPTVAYNWLDAVQITFVCGYGDTADTVPECIKGAILKYANHLYENRDIIGSDMMLPVGIRQLLEPVYWGGYW